MLRVMIVDDEALSAERLKKILVKYGDIDICHVFLNPVEAYEFVKANPIDIAFVDLFMPEMSGFRLSRLLHDLDISVKVVFVCDEYTIQAFEMSTLDVLKKPVTDNRALKMLDKIGKERRGGVIEPSTWVRWRSSAAAEEKPSCKDILTRQETRVLQLLTEGLLKKEIARRLGIGDGTVKLHIKNMYKKLKAHNRLQAVQRAKELKILV